jgi:hypothetical protein
MNVRMLRTLLWIAILRKPIVQFETCLITDGSASRCIANSCSSASGKLLCWLPAYLGQISLTERATESFPATQRKSNKLFESEMV